MSEIVLIGALNASSLEYLGIRREEFFGPAGVQPLDRPFVVFQDGLDRLSVGGPCIRRTLRRRLVLQTIGRRRHKHQPGNHRTTKSLHFHLTSSCPAKWLGFVDRSHSGRVKRSEEHTSELQSLMRRSY